MANRRISCIPHICALFLPLFSFLVSVYLILFFSAGSVCAAGKKRAVLVGINKYELSGNDLKGCVNDTVLVSQALQNVYKFNKEDIKVLNNSEATRDNILRSLREFIIQKSEPGDIAVFYYSGHGYYVADKNGDEADGNDEVLCTYDCNMKKGIYILDDELGEIIEGCKASHFFIGLDCCHSGTGTKSWGEYEYARERFLQNPDVPSAPRDSERAFDGQGGFEKGSSGGGWVLLSGCKSDETSKEDEIDLGGQKYPCGALTRALFLSIASNSTNKNFSYEKMHNDVSKEVTGRKQKQHPQIEGSFQNIEFLTLDPSGTSSASTSSSGTSSGSSTSTGTSTSSTTSQTTSSTTSQTTSSTTSQTSSSTSTSGNTASTQVSGRFCGTVTGIDGNNVTVDVGGSRGITPGSILAVYKHGSTSPLGSNKVGDLEILDSQMLTSKARILGKSGNIERGSPVMEIARNYVKEKLMVAIDSFTGAEELKNSLQSSGTIKLVGKSDYADRVIRQGQGAPGVIEICTMDGTVVNRFKYGAISELSGNIGKALNSAYLIKRLASFTNDNSGMRLDLSLGKKYEFHPGDTAEFTFSSISDCYLILINVGSDGSMTLLYPNQYYKDNFVKKGDTVRIPPPGKFIYRINPPGGQEMIKAIATRDYIDPFGLDLSNLSSAFKSIDGSPEDVIDNLILSFNRKLGGERPMSLERVSVPTTKEWTTTEILYFIIE